MTETETSTIVDDGSTIAVNGTTIAFERRGEGRPLLVIHGGGENAAMHTPQAEDLAAAGFEVITYDRRGTGRSGRDDWPSTDAAAQHADDAAGLIEALRLERPAVLGLSSGGVVALQLAARHRDLVGRVVAWEPPAAGVVPDGAAVTAAMMAPVEQHLAERPGDFVGAQALLLSQVLGFPVRVDDPAFATARENAEPMVTDDPNITLATFDAGDLAGREIVIAVGSEPNPLVAAAVEALASLMGVEPVTAVGDHQVYLSNPAVLTGIMTS